MGALSTFRNRTLNGYVAFFPTQCLLERVFFKSSAYKRLSLWGQV